MILQNSYNYIEFDKQGKLLKLVNLKSDRSYLTENGNVLFRLLMVEMKGDRVFPGTFMLTGNMADKVSFEQSENELKIYFEKLDGLCISADVKVTLKEEDVEWEIAIKNATNFAVKEIEYPFFNIKTPIGNDKETERFLVPKLDGILIGNPQRYPWSKDENGSYSQRYWYPGEGKEMPKNACAQLTAYYDIQEGILIYTADPKGHPKKIGPVYDGKDSVDMTIVHLRPEIPKLNFKLEYKTISRFFEGDWKTAADIYKGFANKAPWCSRTISQRNDIPDWIKKGAFFLSFRLRYQKGEEAYLEYVPEYVNKWKKILEIPMVAMMCGWEKIGEWAGPDYLPPYGGKQRFKEMCGLLRKDGNKAFTFGLSGLKLLIRRRIAKRGEQAELSVDFDGRQKFEEEYKTSAAVDIYGIPILDSNIDKWDGIHGYACPNTGQAKKQICGISLKLLKEYGVIMQQADQVLGGGTTECYSMEHGHPPGRGLWQIESLQKIYDETRKEGKLIDKDFVLSQEWISEPFIQHLDIYHGRNYDKPQGGLESVPLFSYLYHQYIPCYAGDWTSFLPTNQTGVYFHGWNFVCGNLPAGSPIDMLREMQNHEPEEADLKIVEMAKNACREFLLNTEFLIEGQMIKSEELQVSHMEILIEGLDFGFERKVISVPQVLHAFWKSPQGEVACALANVSENELKIEIPLGKYMPKINSVYIEQNGIREEKRRRIRDGVLALDIPARTAMMIREGH